MDHSRRWNTRGPRAKNAVTTNKFVVAYSEKQLNIVIKATADGTVVGVRSAYVKINTNMTGGSLWDAGDNKEAKELVPSDLDAFGALLLSLVRGCLDSRENGERGVVISYTRFEASDAEEFSVSGSPARDGKSDRHPLSGTHLTFGGETTGVRAQQGVVPSTIYQTHRTERDSFAGYGPPTGRHGTSSPGDSKAPSTHAVHYRNSRDEEHRPPVGPRVYYPSASRGSALRRNRFGLGSRDGPGAKPTYDYNKERTTIMSDGTTESAWTSRLQYSILEGASEGVEWVDQRFMFHDTRWELRGEIEKSGILPYFASDSRYDYALTYHRPPNDEEAKSSEVEAEKPPKVAFLHSGTGLRDPSVYPRQGSRGDPVARFIVELADLELQKPQWRLYFVGYRTTKLATSNSAQVLVLFAHEEHWAYCDKHFTRLNKTNNAIFQWHEGRQVWRHPKTLQGADGSPFAPIFNIAVTGPINKLARCVRIRRG